MELNKAFCLYDHSGRRITVVPRQHLKSNEDFFLDVGVYRENKDEDGWDNITDAPHLYRRCNITTADHVILSSHGPEGSKYHSLMAYINQHEEQLNGDNLRAAFFKGQLPEGEEIYVAAWGTSDTADPIMDVYVNDLLKSFSYSV